MKQLANVAMLGGGNMSGAVLARLLESPAAPAEPIRVTTRSAASAARYADDSRVHAVSLEQHADANRAACEGAAVVVLGVKPQQMADVLIEIADVVAPGTVVISLAAGVETASIEARLAEGVRVVRAMPNTPATVGLGVTGIAGGQSADADALATAHALFSAVGEVVEVPEAEIPAIGAITGSGPGHVYLLIENMIAAAMQLGFDEATATSMVVQTFEGSVALLRNEPETPVATHRRRVMSPKGTTEQSIAVLEAARLTEVFAEAFAANIRRSNELAAQLR